MRRFPGIIRCFLPLVLLVNPSFADSDSLGLEFGLNGGATEDAMGEKRDLILSSLIELFRNEKLIAHGIMVDPRGYLLTKASASVGARYARTTSEEPWPIRVRKRDEETDLALWQISEPSKEWTVARWRDEPIAPEYGNWLVSAGRSLTHLQFGVLSAKTRPIGREGGVMGIMLEETNASQEGVKVLEVLPQAAGDRGGLKVMDRILSVDGKPVRTSNQINQILQDRDPGDLLTLLVQRKEGELILRITLGHRAVAFDMFNQNLLMSGPVSKRKDNFPMVLQHDLPLKCEMMGGGLFDLEGNCLGINIARVDRVTTYALPSSVIKPILKKWMGQLP